MKLCLRCNQYFEDSIELCPIDTSNLESVGEHPLIGALINDRYVVDSVIGKGSSGIVYKATRLLMGREVAVKVLHSYLGAETGALDRFLREARAASRLRHPHIINIWESGVTDDAQPYFVMDYLEGMTLADLIKDKGYIHAGRAMPIITQVCEALAAAHRQTIVHRDIKPENIVLQANEGDNNFDDYVKVLDFGIADQPEGGPGQPKAKTAAGSPAYMSPEQCQGFELDHRTDIYSLAIVIFEMLTGMRPFAADDVMKLFYMHAQQPPPTLSSMRPDLRFPAMLEVVVAKALAKKPANRQQSIKEFQKEIEDAFNSADLSGPGKKNESVQVDLFSVPMVDRLTANEGTSTGGHNFLPGPEEWADGEDVGGQEPAMAEPVEPGNHANKPDVSAAVNRLLKSAKRASEAVKKEGDVTNWAQNVLTRTPDGAAPIEDLNPNTNSSTNTSAPAPANNKPVAAGAGTPEVSTWAQKVLKRTSESPGQPSTPPPSATPPPAPKPVAPPPPAPVATPPAPVPSASTRPPARNSFEGIMGSSADMPKLDDRAPASQISKPTEFLKAKAAAVEHARKNSGDLGKAPDVVASPVANTQVEAPTPPPPPPPKPNPVVESASRLFKKRTDATIKPPTSSPAEPAASPSQQTPKQPPVPVDVPKVEPPVSTPESSALNNEQLDVNPFAAKVDEIIQQSMFKPPEPAAEVEPFAEEEKSQEPAEPAHYERDPLDPSRFDHPVNKDAESLNPFAQAIDGLLDAAIMPKTTEDVRRSLSKLKKMEPPINQTETGMMSVDPARFEQPINRSSFDPARFEEPINKGENQKTSAQNIPVSKAENPKSSLQDVARFDQPVNRGIASGTTAGSKMLGASGADKHPELTPTAIDLNRFEQPINRGSESSESMNQFAEAVDGLLDSARIKPEPRMAPESLDEQFEPPRTAADVGRPPDAASIEALDSTVEDDRVQDAVSRLIEAAKRAPEPAVKPELLNKKIEAVKKKIEALKAADVAKPLSSGVPPSAGQPMLTPGPQDSNSLSDAVNRLLEAAQKQESANVSPTPAPQLPVNPFADAYTPPPSSLSSGSSFSKVQPQSPFDAGASTAMNVSPFGQMSADQSISSQFSSSARTPQHPAASQLNTSSRAPAQPVPPDPNKRPAEGSAFQNYVGAQSEHMKQAAELINNAIKSSKTPEVAQDYYSGYRSDPKQIQAERADSLKQSRARVRKNFQNKKAPMWLLILILLAVLGLTYYVYTLPPKAVPLTVDGAIKKGNYAKARELLEAKKKTGPLTPAEVDKLNTVYFQLGLKEAKDGDYQVAIKDLKQIPRKSDLYPAAAAKVREFKKKLSEL